MEILVHCGFLQKRCQSVILAIPLASIYLPVSPLCGTGAAAGAQRISL